MKDIRDLKKLVLLAGSGCVNNLDEIDNTEKLNDNIKKIELNSNIHFDELLTNPIQ
jgi:hypothetical protein